jgi:hypothetical protein
LKGGAFSINLGDCWIAKNTPCGTDIRKSDILDKKIKGAK